MQNQFPIDELWFNLIELDEYRDELRGGIDHLRNGTGNLDKTIEALTSSALLLELLAARIRKQTENMKGMH